MKSRDFLSLTDDEVRRIVSDIFHPVKITCIKRSTKFDEISCKIYTEWEDGDEEKGSFVASDELILKNPFKYGSDSIQVDFSVDAEDLLLLKKFCFANGIIDAAGDLSRNNPYMTASLYRKIQNMGLYEIAQYLADLEKNIASGAEPRSKEKWVEALSLEKSN